MAPPYANLVRCEVKAEEILVYVAFGGVGGRNTSGDVSLECFRQATMQMAVQTFKLHNLQGHGFWRAGGGYGRKDNVHCGLGVEEIAQENWSHATCRCRYS